MKHLFILLFSLLFLTLSTPQTFAQQRLGLMPQRFTLQGKGQTHEAEAFCLDRHLIQGAGHVPYGSVLSGQVGARVRVGNQSPISLQQAIEDGIINITGSGGYSSRFNSGLGMKFISRVDQPVSIELGQPVAFGQKPSWINPAALTPLRQPRSAYTSKLRQDMIWQAETYERRLQVLGYYKGSPHEVTLPRIREAAREFQRDHRLAQTGLFDARTRAALDRAEETLRAGLARIGIVEEPRTDTSVQDVTDVIRSYESYLNRTETGAMSESLRARMAKDEAMLKQVSAITERASAPAVDLASADSFPDVLTFQLYDGGSNVIVKTPQGPELWSYFGGKTVQRIRGTDAIREFDEFSLKSAAASGGETYILQTGVYTPGEEISVAFGPGQLLKIPSAELSSFIDGKTAIPAFDERVAKLTASGAKRARILISRSALNQGRGGDAGGAGPTLFGSSFDQIDPLRLALAWQRKYGDKCDIFIANDINSGFYNLRRLPTVRDGSQIRVFTDGTHFKDYGIISNVKPDLQGAGIKVVQAGGAEAGQPNVILITGRNDVPFRAFLEQLASEGRFEDSIIALASCGEGCEVPFNSMIIRKSGARAVLFYNQRVHPQAVEETLLKFSELLMKKGVPDGNFQQLWRESVEDLLNTKGGTSMPEEVKKLRDAFIQVSGLRPFKSGHADE
jgi:hypothetical protein